MQTILDEQRTQPPQTTTLTLAEIKDRLRLHDTTAEDTRLQAMIQAADEHIEGYTGRALITQTHALFYENFPEVERYVDLLHPPVQSVTVEIASSTGWDALAPERWMLLGSQTRPRIKLRNEVGRPQPYDREMGLRIMAVCGYGDNSADVPEVIREAARMLVTHWHENPEVMIGQDEQSQQLPFNVGAILDGYKLRRL